MVDSIKIKNTIETTEVEKNDKTQKTTQQDVEVFETSEEENTAYDSDFDGIDNIYDILDDSFVADKKDENETLEDDTIEDNSESDSIKDNLSLILTGLSSSAYGEYILNKAVSENEDGSYTINFKGVDEQYTISKDDLDAAKESGEYSSDNDNEILLQMAVKEYFSNLEKQEDGKTADEIDFKDVAALFTDKNFINFDKTGITYFSEQFDKIKDCALAIANITESVNVFDIEGNEIELNGQYTIKSIDKKDNGFDSTITIIDPKNPENEITLNEWDLIGNSESIDLCKLTDKPVASIVNAEIEASMQGSLGDCWLLAGLNSLSYSEFGRELISEAIDYDYDEDTCTVNFKGVDKSYTFSSEDLDAARQSRKYSRGDTDVLLIELAVEQFLYDVKNNDVKLPKDAPNFLTAEDKTEGANPINGGWSSQLLYLFTGEQATQVINKGTRFSKNVLCDELDKLCDRIESNPEGTWAGISFYKDINDKAEGRTVRATENNKNAAIIRDASNNEIDLTGGGAHAWSIKSVDGDMVTIVNPWNSNREVVVSRDELKKYIYDIEYYEYKTQDEETKAA